jgi:6-phosphofructo-2-kinase
MLLNNIYWQLSERGHKFGRALSRFIERQRVAFAEAQDIRHKEEIRLLEQFDIVDQSEGGVALSKSLSACSEKTEQSRGNFVIWTSMLQRAVQTVETFNPAEYDIKVKRKGGAGKENNQIALR